MSLTWRLRLRFIAVGAALGVIGAGLLYYSFFIYGLPEEIGGKILQSSVSPDGKWEARHYVVTSGPDDMDQVAVRRTGEIGWRLAYSGYPASIKWRGQAQLMVKEAESGAVHLLDLADGDAYSVWTDAPPNRIGAVVGMFVIFLFFVGLGWLLSLAVVRRPE
jgi:hypothetical protein